MKSLSALFATFVAASVLDAASGVAPGAPLSVSGIYPHLAYFNNEGECGTGGVVPWAGRLWVITYGPHLPKGSSDKLYEIDEQLSVTVRPESIGGTPANRMIHRESQQLFLGPYAIDAQRNVRAIPYTTMFGRHTGNARHLTDPAGKIYYATMEEGLYEVDVKSLAVNRLWTDEQQKEGRHADLPGYHGKGLYSGQGRVIYANNGEHGKEALVNPAIPSGVLAEWDGKANAWTVVRRNQFTEVTGPGGIYGNANPATDPVWSIGWDHRSLILMVLDGGTWHAYRLPKASHCYDGAHGWNTEWPRIRDIGREGKPDYLMTMHGMFWRFPGTFSAKNSAGLTPRSTYLKVIGDFCRWNDRLVFGCDDSAKSEFLNKRKTKGNLEGPGQSQSNLWFTDPDDIDDLGAPLGRGAVWFDEVVKADKPSDAFLFSGFARRGVHLTHDSPGLATFTFEADIKGNGQWTKLREVTVAAGGYEWVEFTSREKGAWVRVRANRDCAKATAFFQFSNEDNRRERAASMFASLAKPGDKTVTGGIVRARGENKRTLAFAAMRSDAGQVADTGYYELDGGLKLARVEDVKAQKFVKDKAAIPHAVVSADAASVLVVDDKGKRWRLPKGDAAFDAPGQLGDERVDREVCTERDLFNAHGSLYELPAENAGGFAKIRPIATHNRRIHDYCSYRGLLVLTGLAADAKGEHVIRSNDGKASLWVGAVDDLWKIGKARGHGGPWKNSAVRASEPSDPYLFAGYDHKSIRLEHSHSAAVNFRVEVDITGTGLWRAWKTITVAPNKVVEQKFPDAFSAYWVRVVADADCTATTQLEYR